MKIVELNILALHGRGEEVEGKGEYSSRVFQRGGYSAGYYDLRGTNSHISEERSILSLQRARSRFSIYALCSWILLFFDFFFLRYSSQRNSIANKISLLLFVDKLLEL